MLGFSFIIISGILRTLDVITIDTMVICGGIAFILTVLETINKKL